MQVLKSQVNFWLNRKYILYHCCGIIIYITLRRFCFIWLHMKSGFVQIYALLLLQFSVFSVSITSTYRRYFKNINQSEASNVRICTFYGSRKHQIWSLAINVLQKNIFCIFANMFDVFFCDLHSPSRVYCFIGFEIFK